MSSTLARLDASIAAPACRSWEPRRARETQRLDRLLYRELLVQQAYQHLELRLPDGLATGVPKTKPAFRP
ncbi:MAG: hypothetical protein IPK33_09975 [Gemmatimonadetes bacterium]|nr:hypothetical protein [Gemmatimonadota bacterium]